MPRPRTRPSVAFQGHLYSLRPDGYYERFTGTAKLGTRVRHLLHRDIWTAANGPIPDGHHVHHRDLDRSNNVEGNLRAMLPGDHHREHGAAGAYLWTTERRSAERKKEWAKREPRAVHCVGCGVEFQSTGQRAMFHSKPCRRRYYLRERGY